MIQIRRFFILLSLVLPLQAAYAQYNPALLSPQAFLGFDLEERLAGWVEAGGTLMLCGEAHKVSGMIGDDSISPENLALFAGAPLVAGKHQGSGYILYIQEDFAYRAYWLGTNAILANALLFGDKL